MKTNKNLPKEIKVGKFMKPLLNTTETGFNTRVSKHLKKFIYLTSLAGVTIFFSACMGGGYLTSEPSYTERARPQRPSDVHIWIDGNWVWSRQAKTYEYRDGYWQKPYQNKTYVPGHWQSSPRGKYWVKGRWQKQSHHGSNSKR
jgi:hypothetical protein